MKYLFLVALLAVAGCQTAPTAKVGIPVLCQDHRLPPEKFPDTPEAIAKVPPGDMEGLAKLVMKGRVIRDQRLAEDDAQIKACAQLK